ncbi:MAG: hypothetical protein K2L39_04445 [Muribaculaceae bacterium]|nr:hypothetical protein [Muribaculaceae bacterium]
MNIRILHFVILAYTLLAAASSEAASSSTPTQDNAPSHINTLYAGYDLYTLRPKAAAPFSLNGFVVGYSIDFKIPGNHPLYLGTGIDARFTFRNKTFHDTATYDEVKAKVATSFINFNIPLNLSYRLPVTEAFLITPQFGLDLRMQALGKRTTTVTYPSVTSEPVSHAGNFTPGSVNLFSKSALGNQALRRFQAGWHAALKLQYDQFVLGISYGTDFAKLRNELGSSNLLVNLGYVF